MAEEVVKKVSWWKKILKYILKSPVNTIFIVALLYFGVRAFAFDQTFTKTMTFFAIAALWVFWFVAKQVFIFLIVLGLLAGGGYYYYQYLHLEEKKCEESGGYWNKETKACEEKVPLLEQAKRFLKKVVNDVKTVQKQVQKEQNSEQKGEKK